MQIRHGKGRGNGKQKQRRTPHSTINSYLRAPFARPTCSFVVWNTRWNTVWRNIIKAFGTTSHRLVVFSARSVKLGTLRKGDEGKTRIKEGQILSFIWHLMLPEKGVPRWPTQSSYLRPRRSTSDVLQDPPNQSYLEEQSSSSRFLLERDPRSYQYGSISQAS